MSSISRCCWTDAFSSSVARACFTKSRARVLVRRACRFANRACALWPHLWHLRDDMRATRIGTAARRAALGLRRLCGCGGPWTIRRPPSSTGSWLSSERACGHTTAVGLFDFRARCSGCFLYTYIGVCILCVCKSLHSLCGLASTTFPQRRMSRRAGLLLCGSISLEQVRRTPHDCIGGRLQRPKFITE